MCLGLWLVYLEAMHTKDLREEENMNNQRISVAHPFHMVEISPWPLLKAFAVLS